MGLAAKFGSCRSQAGHFHESSYELRIYRIPTSFDLPRKCWLVYEARKTLVMAQTKGKARMTRSAYDCIRAVYEARASRSVLLDCDYTVRLTVTAACTGMHIPVYAVTDRL